MDISRQGEGLRLTFNDNESQLLELAAHAARPVVDTREHFSEQHKVVLADLGRIALENKQIFIGIDRLDDIKAAVRNLLGTAHYDSKQALTPSSLKATDLDRAKATALRGAAEQLLATQLEEEYQTT